MTSISNIEGTNNIVLASRSSGIKKFIYASTDSVVNLGKGYHFVDETSNSSTKAVGYYGKTKAIAENIVNSLRTTNISVFILRPRFVWGLTDTSLIETFSQAIKENRFWWFGNGNFFTSTCHVRNFCHAINICLNSINHGDTYFVTDGQQIILREFISKWLKAYGLFPQNRSIPSELAYGISSIIEMLWKTFKIKSIPPLTKFAVSSIGFETTINDSKIRMELGYKELITIEEGLKEISDCYQEDKNEL